LLERRGPKDQGDRYRLAYGEADLTSITKLLNAMKAATRPVKPQDLGIVGKQHFAAKFAARRL
jgi:hypothetical protein